MRSSLTSTAAGVTVAVIGLVPLLWLMGSSPAEEPPPAPVTPVAASVAAQDPMVTTPPPKPTVVTIDSPTPALAGVGEAATRVLYANGYAQNVAPEDVGQGLPPAVLELLIERDATLTIAVDESTEETP